MFEPKITVGNVIEILTIAIGGLFFLWELRNKLSLLQINQDYFKDRLDKLDGAFAEFSKVTTLIATQSERMSAHSDRMTAIDKKVNDIISQQSDILIRNEELITRFIVPHQSSKTRKKV